VNQPAVGRHPDFPIKVMVGDSPEFLLAFPQPVLGNYHLPVAMRILYCQSENAHDLKGKIDIPLPVYRECQIINNYYAYG